MKKSVKIQASYQNDGITDEPYCGSVGGVLTALGKTHDFKMVGGYSGLCFVTCLKAKSMFREIYPSSKEFWEPIFKATAVLGFVVEITYGGPYRSEPKKDITPEERKSCENFFSKAKKLLTSIERPLIVAGMNHQDFGIVNGYDDKNYITDNNTPFPYQELQTFELIALSIGKTTPELSETAIKDACSRALTYFSGKNAPKDYVFGIAAYDEWIKRILTGNFDVNSHQEHWKWIQRYYARKDIARVFLMRLSSKCIDLERKGAGIFEEAAIEYHQIKQILEQYFELFGFPALDKDIKHAYSSENREKAKELILSMKNHEQTVQQLLEKIVANW